MIKLRISKTSFVDTLFLVLGVFKLTLMKGDKVIKLFENDPICSCSLLFGTSILIASISEPL